MEARVSNWEKEEEKSSFGFKSLEVT